MLAQENTYENVRLWPILFSVNDTHLRLFGIDVASNSLSTESTRPRANLDWQSRFLSEIIRSFYDTEFELKLLCF